MVRCRYTATMKKSDLIAILVVVGFAIVQARAANNVAPGPAQWIETEAEVLGTRSKLRKRSSYTYARVSFTAVNGHTYETEVRLWSIPLVGRNLAPGDTLTIRYNTNNPVIAQTLFAHFIDSYGLYILIIIGVFFSISRLRKTYIPK